MSSGFMPVLPLSAAWDGQPLLDGPAALNTTIYTDPRSPSTSMQLDVWRSMEGHLSFLNDHDIAVDFFQGFNAQGPDSGGIHFASLPRDVQEWWVSYVVARLAPFANVAGFVYSWETGGNGDDLHLARLLREMDPFNHLITYESADQHGNNNFNLTEWSFGSVETYGGVADHHNISLTGYRGKPVYMAEGHMLWRSYWMGKERNVAAAAWAVTTAAASFTWNDMGEHFQTGPYEASQAFSTYPAAAKSIDILADIMTNNTVFYRLVPADELLGSDPPALTFCMAEKGQQYLVYSDSGQAFDLDTRPNVGSDWNGCDTRYSVMWVDAVTGITIQGDVVPTGVVSLNPPSNNTHWVGLLRVANFLPRSESNNATFIS